MHYARCLKTIEIAGSGHEIMSQIRHLVLSGFIIWRKMDFLKDNLKSCISASWCRLLEVLW